MPLPKQPDWKPIPSSERRRLQLVREAWLDAIDEAVERIDRNMARDVKRLVRDIRKGGYSQRAITQAISRFMRGQERRLAITVAEQILQAAHFQQRQADLLNRWMLARRLQERPQDEDGLSRTVTESMAKTAQRGGSVAAERALMREVIAPLSFRIQNEPGYARKIFTHEWKYRHKLGPHGIPDRYRGDKLAKKFLETGRLKRPQEVGLSKRLHRSIINAEGEARAAISRMIRESTNIDTAGRDLIRMVRAGGAEVGGLQETTKLIKRLEKAGKELALRGGAKAQREWDATVKQLKKYAGRLQDYRGKYVELLQDITAPGGKRIKQLDKAIETWSHQTQRYNAERILRTEAHTSFRARDAEYVEKAPYIVALIWRRNRSARAAQKRRRVAKLRRAGLRRTKARTKHRHCICDDLAGRRFSTEAIRSYPRMGHPHCTCWWEKIYSEKTLMDAPLESLTEAEFGELGL